MAFELWYSRLSGNYRKGTTFSEIKKLFVDNLTTKFIYEPLACCKLGDDPNTVGQKMEDLDFDVLGVIDNDEKIIGYQSLKDLPNDELQPQNFSLEIVISDSTPLSSLVGLLQSSPYVFILSENEIVGIVTRADVNKPIFRIYLFSLISLLEIHLNFWINKFFKNNRWEDIINEGARRTALNHFNRQQQHNNELTLLECVHLPAKITILSQSEDFVNLFRLDQAFFQILHHIPKIRNMLAHNQNSIFEADNWEQFGRSIKCIPGFLEKSEENVKEKNNSNHENLANSES